MQRYPSGAQKYAAQICRLWSQFTRGEELVELGPPEKGRHRGEKELAARGLGDSGRGWPATLVLAIIYVYVVRSLD